MNAGQYLVEIMYSNGFPAFNGLDLAARDAAQMGLAVVMAQLQRHRIGLAADAAHILDRQIARRHGDAGFLAQQVRSETGIGASGASGH